VQAKVAKLEAEIAQKPQGRALYMLLAQAYVDAKRPDLAVGVLERGLAVDPHNASFRHKLSQLTGRPEATVEIAGVTTTSPAPAPARPATGPAAQMSPVALAMRPPRPTITPALKARDPRRVWQIAAAAALVAVAVAVKLLVFPSTRLLVAGDFRATSPVWSPTGKHLAFLLTDAAGAHLGIYDFKSKTHRVAGAMGGWDTDAFSWSPDGKRIAYVAPGTGEDWGGTIQVYDVATGQSKRLAAGSSPHWRAGGALVAICAPERPAAGTGYGDESGAMSDWRQRFCRIDADSGAVIRTALAADYGMALSPLLDRVVFERFAEGAAESAVAGATESGDGALQSMADAVLAGRARNVAEGSRDLNREIEARKYMEKRKAARGAGQLPTVEVFAADMDRGEPVRIAAAGEAAYPSWTEAGDRILFAKSGPGGIEFWTMGQDGGDRQPVLANVKVYDPASVRLSPDGKEVFFVAPVEGDPGVARLMTGEEPADLHVAAVGGKNPRRLSNKHSFKHRYAVSPDGERVAYEVLQDVKMIGGPGKSEIWVMSR
jgi:Tol biopolymer transport system component